jgi:hypothetical protein
MSSSSSSTTAQGTTLYHEPSVPHLLTLVALLYLLQLARGIANRVLHAGLLGEIAVGVIFGPVAQILEQSWEETFIVVGYIGLVLIVCTSSFSSPLMAVFPDFFCFSLYPRAVEGGLTLRPSAFLSVLPLAIICALVGVLVPMAFTFALFSASHFGYPPLQAFTAGSALASTSLGTVSTIFYSVIHRVLNSLHCRPFSSSAPPAPLSVQLESAQSLPVQPSSTT